MAENLFEKLEVLVSAKLHDIVNRALRANSPEVMDEYIRRADDSLDDIDHTLAIIQGDLQIQRDKANGLEREVTDLDETARTLVAVENDAQAAVAIAQKRTKEGALEKTLAHIESLVADEQKLQQARAQLEIKIDEMKVMREQLVTALEMAQTKEHTVNTIEDLVNVLEGDEYESFVTAAMKDEAVADAMLDRTLSKHSHLLDPTADPGVAAELARMKNEMTQATEDTDDDPATVDVVVTGRPLDPELGKYADADHPPG